MKSSRAISAFSLPLAISFSTSISRFESSARIAPAAPGRGREGEGDDPRQRRERGQLPRRIDPGEARHVEIHDHDVGGELAGEAKRGAPVGRVADDLNPLLLKQVAKARPEEIVIVDDQDSKLLE